MDEETRTYPEDKDQELRKGIRYDNALYGYIKACYNKSAEHIKQNRTFQQAEKFSRMYEDGNAWAATGQPNRGRFLSEVKISVGFDAIETKLNIITTRVPKPDIQPRFDEKYAPYQQTKALMMQANEAQDPSLIEQANQAYEALKEEASEYASKMQRQIVDDWRESGMQEINRMLYREKKKTGIMIMKSEYDPETNKPKNTKCHITTIFPSPNVESIEAHKYEPFIFAPIVSIKEVEARYGIDADAISEDALGVFEKLQQRGGMTTGFGSRVKAAIANVFKKDKSNQYVVLLECYMPADSDKDVEEYDKDDYAKDENGDLRYSETNEPIPEKVKETRPTFPSGFKRVTVILNHPGWIIEESDNPYKRPPFFASRGYAQAENFWGISELQNVEDLIMRLNRGASDVYDNLIYTGHPILEKSRDAAKEPDPDAEKPNEPFEAKPGAIIETSMPGSTRWIQPPTIGFDIKWWLQEFLADWIDRILHLPDVVRGFNEFSQDSGKKIRELRTAAMGTMQSEIDEQAEFYTQVYKHHVFIYQNQVQGTIVQKVEDDFGDAQYEVFLPQQGKNLTLNVHVSSSTLLPRDTYGEWEEALQLFNLKLEDGVTPLISPEQLIDSAPSLEDKHRIKRYLAKKQEEISKMKQLESAYMQFKQLAEQASVVSEQAPGTPEEDNVAEQIIQLVSQFPEILKTPEFQALPPRLKLSTAAALVGIGAGN